MNKLIVTMILLTSTTPLFSQAIMNADEGMIYLNKNENLPKCLLGK